MNDAGAQRGSTYPYAYRVLHAAIALIVLTLFAMQYVRKPFGDEVNDTVRELHKSLGLVLLVLIVLRIVLRSRMAGPRPFPDPSRFREVTAKLVHKTLWVLMILVVDRRGVLMPIGALNS
ncbi:cytochrome b/b6 domain-containing protein [Aureimonas leprariae]|uniref:Cytochrome b561 bacterial/Ni-hydrogenase domain-containing protein n=1 Tax=Plantimonas leprariae TaxID=2615207 RepID=A0A7V7PKM1_9HYPH|nr:cytochrome b/b6 domain-containing protein [Aureimonas leprariae]KAB0676440.1 hypothetical protein F6X38_21345 [Aureimonas leprariae]